jgi:hypothetical protein
MAAIGFLRSALQRLVKERKVARDQQQEFGKLEQDIQRRIRTHIVSIFK